MEIEKIAKAVLGDEYDRYLKEKGRVLTYMELARKAREKGKLTYADRAEEEAKKLANQLLNKLDEMRKKLMDQFEESESERAARWNLYVIGWCDRQIEEMKKVVK